MKTSTVFLRSLCLMVLGALQPQMGLVIAQETPVTGGQGSTLPDLPATTTTTDSGSSNLPNLLNLLGILDLGGISGSGRFSTLVLAIGSATSTLQIILNSLAVLTMFAPTNAAFDALPVDDLDFLLNNPSALTRTILYNIVPGFISVNEGDDIPTPDQRAIDPNLGTFMTMLPPESLSLEAITTTRSNGIFGTLFGGLLGSTTTTTTVLVNDVATIVLSDVLTSQGIIQAVDTLLIPPGVVALLPSSESPPVTLPALPPLPEEVVVPDTAPEERKVSCGFWDIRCWLSVLMM